jgi:hypothetical protein
MALSTANIISELEVSLDEGGFWLKIQGPRLYLEKQLNHWVKHPNYCPFAAIKSGNIIFDFIHAKANQQRETQIGPIRLYNI